MDEECDDGSVFMAEDAGSEVGNLDDYCVDTFEDIARIDMLMLSEDDIYRFHFADLSLAYEFYNWYARMKGFSARKSKTRKNNLDEVVQQTFVCFREGFRHEKYYQRENRIREPKPETRCGCNARIQVHVEVAIGRWIVTDFFDKHNHEAVDARFVGMLRSHKKMGEGEISQMNSMMRVGISAPLIFGSFACQSGGYEHVGFGTRDMYNKKAKERRQVAGDAKAAMLFLKDVAKKDPWLFCRDEVDDDGALRHLFWCDGRSQLDYMVFGDVIAFDATYKKNKYKLPLVIFSGVNHHNQTVVFAAALVSDESKETYVWLLEQFLTAMKGKAPVSVITDGDASMKSAIEIVFPTAHHRLCAWHLMRNATSNIGQPGFTTKFKKCMLGDYELGVFQRKWQEMVEEFGVEDRPWIIDLYVKREMWATAHIRGKFFAGFRTTSRCEGLHSLLGKYVKSRYDLTQFLQHFERCLSYLRFKEWRADFGCEFEPVMQTHLQQLERSASDIYTREVFFMFRPMLHRAGAMKVVFAKETLSCVIYGVSKYCKPNSLWHVSYYEEQMQFKCSCLRMESLGIPCDHIIAVLVYLDISELPQSLVLDRWTKNAKEAVIGLYEKIGLMWDPLAASRHGCLAHWCKEMCVEACRRSRHFNAARDMLISLVEWIKADNAEEDGMAEGVDDSCDAFPREPNIVRTKGTSRGALKRKPQRCGVCRCEGHNRASCPVRKHTENLGKSGYGDCLWMEDAMEEDIYNEELYTEIVIT